MCARQKKKQTFVDFPLVNFFHFFMQRNSWSSFLTRLTQLLFVKCCWALCSSVSTCCAHVQTPTRSVHAYSSLVLPITLPGSICLCRDMCSLPWAAALLWSQWKLLEQRGWWPHWLQSWCPLVYTMVPAVLKLSCLHAVLQMCICPGSLRYILQKWVSISCPEDNLWLGWYGQRGAHSFETTLPAWASPPCCHISARMELSKDGADRQGEGSRRNMTYVQRGAEQPHQHPATWMFCPSELGAQPACGAAAVLHSLACSKPQGRGCCQAWMLTNQAAPLHQWSTWLCFERGTVPAALLRRWMI